jgi:hypothetical protein
MACRCVAQHTVTGACANSRLRVCDMLLAWHVRKTLLRRPDAECLGWVWRAWDERLSLGLDFLHRGFGRPAAGMWTHLGPRAGGRAVQRQRRAGEAGRLAVAPHATGPATPHKTAGARRSIQWPAGSRGWREPVAGATAMCIRARATLAGIFFFQELAGQQCLCLPGRLCALACGPAPTPSGVK